MGCWTTNNESFEAWDECLKGLKERGLKGIIYVVSDDNKGLRNAIDKQFQGVLWQRCQVHFMRNFLGKLAKSEQKGGIRLLKNVFATGSKEEAKKQLEKVEEFLKLRRKDPIWKWIEENKKESLMVLELPVEHRKKMKSTNTLERANQESKRRSRIVRIFLDEPSCLRLLSPL